MRFTLLTGAVGLTVLSGCAVVYSYGDYEDGAGGQGGSRPPAACTVDGDCTVDDTECGAPACNDGLCGVRAAREGTKKSAQIPGDCKISVCDGRGGSRERDDDKDVQADSNDCTEDICVDGAPAHPFKAANTQCGQSGATRCDDAGHCVGCTNDGDCPQATDCASSRCDGGACKAQIEQPGTSCGPQQCSDESTWSSGQCDDAGACVAMPEACAPFRCADGGCPTACTDSSQCQAGLRCDNGACVDCATCSEWLNGSVAAHEASFCTRSAALQARVAACGCRHDAGLCLDLTCSTTVCDGSQPISDACGVCVLDNCEGANACAADR